MTAQRFTPERRERLLTLLEAGRNVEEACADVDVSRATVSKWRLRGRLPGADASLAEFSARFDAVRGGSSKENLSTDDLVRLLERSARNGSVQAIKLLLERPWEVKDADDHSKAEPADPFTALEGNELAQRRAARGGSSAAHA